MVVQVPVVRQGSVQQQGFDARQNISTPANAFGANVAQARIAGGQQLVAAGDKLHERSIALSEARNKAKAKEAERNLLSWQLEYLHNPETGAYRRRGANALDVTRQTVGEYQKMVSKYSDELENDEQRTLFSSIAMNNEENLMTEVSKFERDELYAYSAASRQAVTGIYKNAAKAAASDPQAMEGYFNMMRENMAEDGTPKAAIDLAIDQERSTNINAHINAKIEKGDYAGAIGYYDRFKDYLVGDDVSTTEVVVKKAQQTVRTTAQAADIVSRNKTQADGIREARATAEKEGQEYADDLITRVKQSYGEKEAVMDQQRSQTTRNAWSQIGQGAGPEAIPVWADSKTRTAMQKVIANGGKGTGDYGAFTRLQDEYLQKPGDFATKDISSDLVNMTPEQRNQVLQWQEQAATGLSDSQLKANEKKLLSKEQAKNEATDALRKAMGDQWVDNTAVQSKAAKNAKNRFFERFERSVELEAERQGKESLSREEVRKIADDLLVEGRMKRGGWFDKAVRGFEVPDDRKADFYIPYDEIPEAERLRIRQVIRVNNQKMKAANEMHRLIPDTSEGVTRVYNAQKFKRSFYEVGPNE